MSPAQAGEIARTCYGDFPGADRLILEAVQTPDPGRRRRALAALDLLDPDQPLPRTLTESARAIAAALEEIILTRDPAARRSLESLLRRLADGTGPAATGPPAEAPPRLDPARRAFHVFSTGEWKTWVETRPGEYDQVDAGPQAAAKRACAGSAQPVSFAEARRRLKITDYAAAPAPVGTWTARLDLKVWGRGGPTPPPLHCYVTSEDGRRFRLTAFRDGQAAYSSRDGLLDLMRVPLGARLRVRVGRNQRGDVKWISARTL